MKVIGLGAFWALGITLYMLLVAIPKERNDRFREWTSRIKVGMTKGQVAEIMQVRPVSTNYHRWYFSSFPWGGKLHPLQLDFYCDFESGKVANVTECFTPDD